MTNRYAHLAPLFLRVAAGLVFIAHGYPKFLAPDGFAEFFGQVGIPAPYVMVLLVGAVEVIGGALLIAGYGTRVAAALLSVVMLVAIVTAKFAMGFANGWAYDFMLMAACLSLVLSGPTARQATE